MGEMSTVTVDSNEQTTVRNFRFASQPINCKPNDNDTNKKGKETIR